MFSNIGKIGKFERQPHSKTASLEDNRNGELAEKQQILLSNICQNSFQEI